MSALDDEEVDKASSADQSPSPNHHLSVYPSTSSSTARRRISRNTHPAMTESTKQTAQEMKLKRKIREEGTPVDHAVALDDLGEETGERVSGSGRRSRQKTVFVDLGNGPEEVVMIDWAEGDPEVSLPELLYLRVRVG